MDCMHIRTRAGTRIEETARTVDQIEQMIRQIIPANQVQMIIDNLGIPYSGINTTYNNTGTMSPADGDILVSLKENHGPTEKFVEAIRARAPHDFPDIEVWFPPADIVSQIKDKNLRAELSELLGVLDNRQRKIIFERFGWDGGKPKTLEEVGKKFEVTRERIGQLQNIALAKLRRAHAKREKPIVRRDPIQFPKPVSSESHQDKTRRQEAPAYSCMRGFGSTSK